MKSSLEDLLKTAEEATSAPKIPPYGIPKQKLPGWVRWPVRIVILPLLHLEMTAEKIAKAIIRPPFKKIGQCKRRGNCCHYILLPEVKGILGKFFNFWHTEIYGFYRRTEDLYEHEGKKIHVMGCRYLDKNGKCSKYIFRPKVCRTWPLIEIFAVPRVLKGCGYQAVLKESYAKKYPGLKMFEETREDKG